MSCKQFRPAIAAHAGGAPLAAAAAGHLAECAGCRRTLDTQVRLLAELDGELERTLSITASPEFAARAARQARDAGELKAQRRIPAALWAGTGVAAAIALAAWTGAAFRPFDRLGAVPSAGEGRLRPEGTQADRVRDTATEIAATKDRPRPEANGKGDRAVVRLPKAARLTTDKRPVRSKMPQAGKPPAPDCVASGVPPPPNGYGGPSMALAKGGSRKAAACPMRTPGATEPPVIVDPRRALALARLRELMTEGRLDGSMLPPARTPEAVLAELTVAPLEIPDIPVPAVETVDRRSTAPRRQ
jgi:hypothetical protein